MYVRLKQNGFKLGRIESIRSMTYFASLDYHELEISNQLVSIYNINCTIITAIMLNSLIMKQLTIFCCQILRLPAILYVNDNESISRLSFAILDKIKRQTERERTHFYFSHIAQKMIIRNILPSKGTNCRKQLADG